MLLSYRLYGDTVTIRSLLLAVGALLCTGIVCADQVAAVQPEASGGARESVQHFLSTQAAAVTVGATARTRAHRRELLIGRVDPDHDDGYKYRLPYGEEVSYPVIQAYGSRLSHRGTEYFTVDFRMDEGTPVHSAREGLVILVEDSNTESCWTEGCGSYANFIVVLHSDGTTGEYFHLQAGSAMVGAGDFVARGHVLAKSGNTGYTTSPHLHFGVYRASADGTTHSIAVRFVTRGGLVAELRTGSRYLNLEDVSAGRRVEDAVPVSD